MRNFRWLIVLMCAAIAGVTLFLSYWLYQSYGREKTAMDLKMNMAFRETVIDLQTAKLHLGNITLTSKDEKQTVRVVVAGGADSMKITARPRQEIISTVNVIRNKINDSLKKQKTVGMVIAMDKNSPGLHDGNFEFDKLPPPGSKNDIMRLLISADSLQDSIRLNEVDSAFNKKLALEKIQVPFSVHKTDSCSSTFEPAANQVVVGFARPVVFELKKGNSLPYLLKKISLPLLFAALLLSLTVLSFVFLFRNMIKQKRLAEQKNEFISNITHELKTPVATVGVAIEALKSFNAIEDPARTKEYLDISQNELHRLSLLVDKVLKLSMFEKKEMELKFETVNMAELIKEVTDSFKLQFEKHKAAVSINSSGDTNIQGDRLHLLSVLFNLVDNALKYCDKTPVIHISAGGGAGAVTITVTDNGIGIPSAYKEKVFEKFFRVPHGDTHNAKGYGLGLSYVAQVVEKHNGFIRTESDGSSGSSFIITLPKSNKM